MRKARGYYKRVLITIFVAVVSFVSLSMFCARQIHKHHGLSALAKRSFHVLFEGENYRKFPRSSVSSDLNLSSVGYSGSDRSDSGFSGSVYSSLKLTVVQLVLEFISQINLKNRKILYTVRHLFHIQVAGSDSFV